MTKTKDMQQAVSETAQSGIQHIQAGHMKMRSLRRKLGVLAFAALALLPGTATAETNSHSAQAVLHLQVTVMPVLMPAAQQSKAATSTPVAFNLQGDNRTNAARNVTQGPMPDRYELGDGKQQLETTTVVVN